MSATTKKHTDNIVIGAGELYIDLLDADDGTAGERYLGDGVGASLSVTTERVQVFSGTGPVARKLVDAVRSINRSMSITLHDMSHDNLALFVGATEVKDVTDAVNQVTDEALTVRKGRWYQLGVKTDKPTGIGATAAKTVVTDTDTGSPTTYDAGDDYTVDAKRGRLYIVPGGDIADDAAIHVDYTPVAATRKLVKTGDLKDLRAALRYIETPVAGKGRDYYAPLCSIGPSGEIGLMNRDSEQQIQLTAAILEPGGSKAALLIDGEAA